MRFRNLIAGLGILSILWAGAVPAVAAEKDPPSVELEITETEGGFSFGDLQAEKEMAQLRSATATNDGDTQILMQAASGVPVIAYEQYALPDFSDHDAEYEKAVKEAQVERAEPEFLADGESAYEERTYQSEEAVVNPDDLRPRGAFAVTPTTAHFHLTHGESYEKQDYKYFQVIRDGEEVAIENSPSFVDDGLAPNTTYNYRIIASEVDPLSTKEGDEEYFANTKVFTITTPPVDMKAARSGTVATASAVVSTQAYMHTTFIPIARAEMSSFANLGCWSLPSSRVEFSGDNRDFQVPTFQAPYSVASYRTLMFANVGFENPAGNRFFTVKDVSPTKKYVNGALKETRTASSNNMTFGSLTASSTYAQMVVNHKAGNPFCVAGAITYHDEVRFYRNANMVELQGWRYPVPNHEISFRFDTPAAPGSFWLPAYWGGNAGFGCLVGYCTRDDYTKSMTGL